MTTSKVSIEFPSYYELRAFMRNANFSVDGFEISLTKFILTCPCTKEQLELAVEFYGGTVKAMHEREK